jgi:hypothetical protein
MENENLNPYLNSEPEPNSYVFAEAEPAPVEETKEDVVEAEEKPVIKIEDHVKPTKKQKVGDLVAIYSPKKVSMGEYGVLNIGVNHVTKEVADAWLAAKHYVRLVKETDN